MVTMIDDDRLHRFVAGFYEAGKVTAAVCHGKRWTGFADAEEAYVEQAIGQKVQPFWIETEAREIEGTHFEVAGPLEAHAIRDGNLVTGQQQVSASAAAREIVAALS
jgi:putative intracellular protease/amidase